MIELLENKDNIVEIIDKNYKDKVLSSPIEPVPKYL